MQQGADAAERIPGWLELAVSGPVVRRAGAFLVIVGGILIAINHGDAVLRGDVDAQRLVKMVLTPLVPYVVSTLSSVSALRAAARARAGHDAGSDGEGDGAAIPRGGFAGD